MAEEEVKQRLERDPHLNPLPQGEEDAKRPVRVLSRVLLRIVEVVIAGVFIFAGLIKIFDFPKVDLQNIDLANLVDGIRSFFQHIRFADSRGFAIDIDNYKILPWSMALFLAFYLPWLEILCGLALIFRVFYYGALSILTALTSVFIIASIVAKSRGLDITCGCFGHVSQNWSFSTHLAVDFGILVALLALWSRSRQAQLL